MSDEDMITVAIDDLCHVPSGLYEVVYEGHETNSRFNAKKVVLSFRITGPNYVGQIVKRFYNVQRFVGKPGPGGKFVPGKRSHFYREYLNLFEPNSRRVDRLSMSKYRNCPVLAQVREVTLGVDGMPLARAAQYSVIDRLLPLDQGDTG